MNSQWIHSEYAGCLGRQTKRHLQTRVNEHERNIRYPQYLKIISKHITGTDHIIDWNNIKTMDRESNCRYLVPDKSFWTLASRFSKYSYINIFIKNQYKCIKVRQLTFKMSIFWENLLELTIFPTPRHTSNPYWTVIFFKNNTVEAGEAGPFREGHLRFYSKFVCKHEYSS